MIVKMKKRLDSIELVYCILGKYDLDFQNERTNLEIVI